MNAINFVTSVLFAWLLNLLLARQRELCSIAGPQVGKHGWLSSREPQSAYKPIDLLDLLYLAQKFASHSPSSAAGEVHLLVGTPDSDSRKLPAAVAGDEHCLALCA